MSFRIIAPGRNLLHEDVLLEHHLLAGRRPETLEHRLDRRRPVVPGRDRHDDRLHVGDALNGLAMPVGPVEAERGAPIVDYERDVLDSRPSVSSSASRYRRCSTNV